MSRGPGVVQRWLLAQVEREAERDVASVGYPKWTSVPCIAGYYARSLSVEPVAERPLVQRIDDALWAGWVEPTRAQVESFRRAARRLADAGTIDIGYESAKVPMSYVAEWGRDYYGERFIRRHSTTEAKRFLLAVRRPLTEPEQQAERDDERRRLEELKAKSAAAFALLRAEGFSL